MIKKRLIPLLLVTVILFTALGFCGFAAVIPGEQGGAFLIFDRKRAELLCGGEYESVPHTEEGYIVAFKKEISETEVEAALSVYDYEPLANSSERIFAVYSAKATEINSGLLRYIIPNAGVEISLSEIEAETGKSIAGVTQSLSYGGENAIIAVLDSGIDRSLPTFSNADILEGIDYIDEIAGVYEDTASHGTKVTSILVSGDIGICKSATVLPIRITDDGKTIRTSDLVKGIYFAADYGVDIINMSFGGYTENRAEHDAVEYAYEKGCILISASGNEGQSAEYGGKKCYPASFDGVIGVASVDAEGNISPFSQYNEYVDIAAIGEGIAVYSNTENGEELSYANGTSYACAVVSGVAALVVSASKRELNSDSFLKLLEYSSETEKNDFTGYGIINAEKLLENADKPIVFGVRNNGIYFDEISPCFENATALLDGEEYYSGESVFAFGRHKLCVSDEYGSVEFDFAIDTLPLEYDMQNDGDSVLFVFERGSATLNGKKYVSGEKITADGSYEFVLTGPYGNSVKRDFVISSRLPSVYGVENGKTYTNGVKITVLGSGYAYLDGAEFEEKTFAFTNGSHILRITNLQGDVSAEICFDIEAPEETGGELIAGNLVKCGLSEYYACWGNMATGLGIVGFDAMDSMIKYIPAKGNIITVKSDENYLYVIASEGYDIYLNEDLLKSDLLPVTTVEDSIVSASVYEGSVFYATAEGYIKSEKSEPLFIGGDTSLCACDGVFAYSSYTPGRLYVFSENDWSVSEFWGIPEGKSIFASAEKICIGDSVYTRDMAELLYQLPENEKILLFGDNGIITAGGVYDYETGNPLGSYQCELNSAYYDGEKLFLVDNENRYAISAYGGLCGSAEVTDNLFKRDYYIGDYEYTVPLLRGEAVEAALYDKASDNMQILLNDNRLCFAIPENGMLSRSIYLRYKALKLAYCENGNAVIFAKNKSIYITSRDEYITFPEIVVDVCEINGNYYALSPNKVYEYNQNGEISVVFQGEAIGLYGNENVLYIVTEDCIFCRNVAENTQRTIFTSSAATMEFTENYIIVSDTVYDKLTGEAVFALDSPVVCADDFAVITEESIYSSDMNTAFENIYGEDKIALARGSVFVFEKSKILIIACGNDITAPFEVSGITDGGTYEGQASFSVENGIVYIDGKKQSGSEFEVTSGGNHILKIVLPFGRYAEYNFTVVCEPSYIKCETVDITLAVGETYKPNAEIVPAYTGRTIVYTCDGDAVEIDTDGTITAVSQGQSRVLLRISGTPITAEIIVTVSADNIECNNQIYKINRKKGCIYGVEAGITVGEFSQNFNSFGCEYVFVKNGRTVGTDSLISTGTVMSKLDSEGKITDKLNICVKGDIDCDGRVTVSDADMLFRHLKGSVDISGIKLIACDVNMNTMVTETDLKALYNIMDYDSLFSGESNSTEVSCPDFFYASSVLPYSVYKSDSGEFSLAGNIKYDKDILRVAKISTDLSGVYAVNTEGELHYCILDTSRADVNDKLICVYFELIDKSVGSVSVKISGNCVENGELMPIEEKESVVSVKEAYTSALRINVGGNQIRLKSNIYTYGVTLPYGSKNANIECDCPEDCYVYTMGSTSLNTGENTIIIRYVTPNAQTEYRIIVTVSEEYIKSSDSSLAFVKVSGAELEPGFSPDIYEYEITSDFGDISFEIKTSSEKASYRYETRFEGDDIIYGITCTAEDGSQSVYIIRVHEKLDAISEEESSAEESEAESEPASEEISVLSSEIEEISEEPEPSNNSWIYGLSIAAFVIIAVCAVIIIRKAKRI